MMASNLRQRFKSGENANRFAKPDVILDDENGTLKLTPLGRYQVMNRICKPELGNYQGNPDEQPVRSFEIGLLVKILLLLSTFINSNYCDKISRLYNKEGFIGLFVRQLVSPPTSYVKLVKQGLSLPPQRQSEFLPPRINLRFLANKHLLFYSFLTLLFVRLLGFSLIWFHFSHVSCYSLMS